LKAMNLDGKLSSSASSSSSGGGGCENYNFGEERVKSVLRKTTTSPNNLFTRPFYDSPPSSTGTADSTSDKGDEGDEGK
jgi:hypothetical protein